MNKLLFLDNDANVEIGFIGNQIDVNFKHNVAGYIIIAFGNKKKDKICPGDFVFVTYDDVPIIKDMQCGENFEEAVEDNVLGGKNDWYIQDFTKYEKGGWMVKA